MPSQPVRRGDFIWLTGIGWVTITSITTRTSWGYTPPGGGATVAMTTDLLAYRDKEHRSSPIGAGPLDGNAPSH